MCSQHTLKRFNNLVPWGFDIHYKSLRIESYERLGVLGCYNWKKNSKGQLLPGDFIVWLNGFTKWYHVLPELMWGKKMIVISMRYVHTI